MDSNEMKRWEAAYNEAYPQTPYEEKAEAKLSKKRLYYRVKLTQIENSCFLIDYYKGKEVNAETEAEKEYNTKMIQKLDDKIDELEKSILRAILRK